MSDKQHTRRQVLVGTGTLAAGTIGSIALLSDNATATVDGSFSIPNAEAITADTTVQDVRLSATVDWGFQANALMHAVEIELHVGATANSLDLIARHEQGDLGKEALTGTDTLSGSLMSAADFDIADFQPTSGELTTGVVAELRFYVLRDGTVEAEAREQTSFDVTVRDEELTVATDLSATGEVSFTTG